MGENPINVKMNVILESNVYIDECPPSIPKPSCAHVIMIEGDQAASEVPFQNFLKNCWFSSNIVFDL